MVGHMLKDCPLIPKIWENRKFKMRKDDKKLATWSNRNSSEIENDEELTTNIYLPAKEAQNDNETEYESSDQVNVSALYGYSKE